VPEEGCLVLGVRQYMAMRKEKRGNAAVQSSPARLFGSYDAGLGRDAVFRADRGGRRSSWVPASTKAGTPQGGETSSKIKMACHIVTDHYKYPS